MTPAFEFTRPRLLIVMEVPDPRPLPKALLDTFSELKVLLMGYRVVPDQTSPEQAREEYEKEAREALERVADEMPEKAEVDTKLVFTSSLAGSIGEIIEQQRCDAVLTSRPVERISSLLIPLHGETQQPRLIAGFTAKIVEEGGISVTLLRMEEAVGKEGRPDWTDPFSRAFEEAGLEVQEIDVESIEADGVVEEVADLSEHYDVIIIGAEKATMKGKVFGEIHEGIIAKTRCPVIVVLHHEEEEEAGDDTGEERR
ncbi:MAG: universal stress protein [bacterium]